MIDFIVVGTGGMAKTMAQAIRLHPETRLSAVVSRSPNRAATLAAGFEGALAACSIAELLASRKVDAVYVATLPEEQPRFVLEALEAGLPTLCEKPMATTSEAMRDLLSASKEKNVLLVEGYWTLSLPAVRQLLGLKSDPRIGLPRHLSASFGYKTLPTQRPNLFRSSAGGVLLDRFGYLTALAIQLMGPVIDVDANVIRDDDGVDRTVYARFGHEGGAVSTLSASLDLTLENRISVSFENGYAELGPPGLKSEALIWRYEEGHSPPEPTGPKAWIKKQSAKVSWLRRIKNAQSGGRWLSYGNDPYLPQLDHMVELIKRGAKDSDFVPASLSNEISGLTARLRQSK